MSYRHPKHKMRAGEVVDIDDVNENFKAFTEEAESKLNEHNFSVDAFERFPAKGSPNEGLGYTDDIAMRLYTTRTVVEDDLTLTTGGEEIGSTGAWQTIDSVALDSRGGAVWIVCSAQLASGQPGAQLGLAINGVVLPNTASHTIDHQVETPLDPSIEDPNEAGGIFTPGGGTYKARQPYVLTAFVPVAPGPVIVELLAMAMAPWAPETSEIIRVFTREIIAIEVV